MPFLAHRQAVVAVAVKKRNLYSNQIHLPVEVVTYADAPRKDVQVDGLMQIVGNHEELQGKMVLKLTS
jgi:hypothetical protein